MNRKSTAHTAADSKLRTHFCLTSVPFTRELTVRERWRSPHFDEPLRELRAAVEQRASAALIAPAGTGKTALLRQLVDDLPQARYHAHYIKVTSLGKRELCRELAVAAGVEPAGTYPTLVRRLQTRYVSTLQQDGCRTVAILDDTHDMPPTTLGQLRVLTNFDMDSRLVISLLLCGQPRLSSLLRREEVEPLTGRLAAVATLRLLSRDEVCRYVEHRMSIAGAKTVPFDPMALEALYEVTQGNLRAVDTVALKALELAAHKKVPTIDSSLIGEARQRLP